MFETKLFKPGKRSYNFPMHYFDYLVDQSKQKKPLS
jgi:hypothetical protein